MIYYHRLDLDRGGEQRKNQDWLIQQWMRRECRILVLQHDKNLMRWHNQNDPRPEVISLFRDDLQQLINPSTPAYFLGLEQGQPVFALDISELDDASVAPFLEMGEFMDLRNVGWWLEAQQAALLAYARGLAFWNRHHQFCGKCGHPTQLESGGYLRCCTNSICGKLHFPRTDPAVIMLVEDLSDPDHPRCLLGRNARFPGRLMSTLAGFVDPLESLEETVAREVYEECGVRVTDIAYQASQPWPFPSSIMLGFRARALTREIKVDQREIEEAHWFDAEQLQTFGEWGDSGDHYCLPRRDSIARWLIQVWLDEQLHKAERR